MMQRILKNGGLWVICGVLEAVCALLNIFMLDADGSLTWRTHFVKGTILLLGRIALAAGVCSIIASFWKSPYRKPWLFLPHGLALSALGLTFMFWRGPLSFHTVALLMVAMALGLLLFALANANKSDGFHLLAASAFVIFAAAFLGLGFRLIRLPQQESLQMWIGCFFGFGAVYIFRLALVRLNRSWTGTAGAR